MQRPKILICLTATVAIAAAMTLLADCDEDKRLVELSRESSNRQAEQNRQIAQQSQQVAEATHDLVREDAAARAEWIAAQHALETSLQAERKSLDQQRVTLADERREAAAERNREPIIAAAITSAGLLVVLALPLVLCLYLVRSLRLGEASAALEELLVCELVSEEPALLPRPLAGLGRPALDSPEAAGVDE
jgi:hypothetical protein